MPKAQRKREKVEYDGKESSRLRNAIEAGRHGVNKAIQAGEVSDRIFTPWEASKDLRRVRRALTGKTYENWVRNNAKSKPKANVSNLEV